MNNSKFKKMNKNIEPEVPEILNRDDVLIVARMAEQSE